MISLLQKYKRLLAWFISGLVLVILISLGISHQQPATASQPNSTESVGISDFATTHLEPNFYQ
ncbi:MULTISPECIES: hypothetical protein [unclassified Nostoc]|uniref:hypothetical protein n=1 Tax=unclassified Nostoc TaxID=2593658 RepID=UPI000DEC184C|nr:MULTISPECIES: hypothetical protein [unclassified Nostoc]MBE8989991.1 hypothetical protein [Nostoc sp. LEGE 12450]QHG20444.1 hypothetical protein GJB62_31565 [Nostoc sp. ATCC 53789]RCJ28679.1 hypothetical protein A6V25_16170 [Nostoc sp. ATCC 53789]